MKTGYEVLKTSLAEAANDNLNAAATLKLVINDLDFAGMTITPTWAVVDYSKPLMVINDDVDGSFAGGRVFHGDSVTDLRGDPGDLVAWWENGQVRAEWFDAIGKSSHSLNLRVVNVPAPAPVAASAGTCGACGADRRAS
ncbi:hypothetical protein [Thalassospira sp.]|uniref:hypothetical protein n=1 Tax=Thalassospira sp. TaxID=1912094 RepID=UPI003AA7EFAC